MNLSFGFVFAFIATYFSLVSGNIIGDAIRDIGNAVEKVTCPSKYTSQYETCANIINPLFTAQAAMQGDKLKEKCCARLSLVECVGTISYLMCGPDTGETMAVLGNGINQLTAAGQCIDYQNVFQCTNPIVLIVVLIIIASIIVLIINCLCNMCFKACQ